MTYLQLQYNGYNYNANVDWPATFLEGLPAKLRTVNLPGRDGAFTAGGLIGPKRPQIKGKVLVSGTGVVATDLAALRTAWDNFKLVHAPGVPKALYVDTDRYLNAEVENIADGEWDGLLYRDYTVAFFCADPYWYSSTSNVVNFGGANAGGSATTTGNATTLPTLSIPVTTAAGTITITIIAPDGTSCTGILTPASTGTYVISGSLEIVTLAGVDKTAQFSGQFPRMGAGSGGVNTVLVTPAGGAAFNAPSIGYQDRWF